MRNGPQDELQETMRWVADTWSMYFREVLEAMTFEQLKVAVLEPQSARGGAEEPVQWWKQTLNYPEHAAIWIGASPTACAFLANKVLGAAGVEENDPDLIIRTYHELVQQTTPALARVLGSRFEREVTCSEGQEEAAGPPSTTFSVEVRYPNDRPVHLTFGAHPALAEQISRVEQPIEENQGGNAPRVPGDSKPGALAAPAVVETGPPKTIDLLLDVELPVSVSFGRAYLPLKDVLRLTSGSIVELNRPVADPVEVIVNNCVIARGEVVVIDGNYGVRINQIISRRERLRTLT